MLRGSAKVLAGFDPQLKPIRLQYWRERRGLRLKDLSQLTGVPFQTLNRWERQGKMPGELLPILQRALRLKKLEDLYEPAYLVAMTLQTTNGRSCGTSTTDLP